MKRKSPKRLPAITRLLRNAGLTISVLVLLGGATDFSLSYFLSHQFNNNQKVEVAFELSAIRAKIEERLNVNLYLVYGVAASIAAHDGISSDDFNELAQISLSQSDALRNIAAAPDFVIRYVYPLRGNEAVLGLDYRKVPEQWQRALDAKQTKKMAIAGPVNLVQGGRGLIARVPVFINEGRQFWGLVSAVLDLDELVQQIGLLTEHNTLTLALSSKGDTDQQGNVFFGRPALFDPSSEAIIMPVSLSSLEHWQLAATPAKGWVSSPPYMGLVHLCVWLVTFILCFSSLLRFKGKIALIESEHRLQAMSDASLDALIMTDSKDIIKFWNPAAEHLFGYTQNEALGQRLHQLVVPPAKMMNLKSGLEEFAKSGQGPVINTTMEMEAMRKSGDIFPVERTVSSFQLRGEWHAVGSVRDITSRKEFERRLTELATIDALTGLANRRHFIEQAENQLRQAKRYGQSFSLLMFDIDYFKRINDSYGHDVGDKLLEMLGGAVQEILRETDIIGRMGGEEFLVAMPETDLNVASLVAERIRAELMKIKVRTSVGTIGFTVSIGLTQLSDTELTLSDLMKKVDLLLYEAKAAGKNNVMSR